MPAAPVSARAFEITPSPTARRAVARLPEKVGMAVVEFSSGPPANTPHRVGKALRLNLEGMHTARRGDFPIV